MAKARTGPQRDRGPSGVCGRRASTIAQLQAGAGYVCAGGAAGDGGAAPRAWIGHDPVTGARSPGAPLPPPETAQRLADALAAIAGALGPVGR